MTIASGTVRRRARRRLLPRERWGDEREGGDDVEVTRRTVPLLSLIDAGGMGVR